MRHVLRSMIVLVLIALAAAAVSAQGPSGGRSPTPTSPATRPALPQDFEDVLQYPEQALAELTAIIQAQLDDFIRENRVRVDANAEAWPDAISSPLTRVIALGLGIVLLMLPNSTKVWAWLFLGAVAGLIVAQLPIGDEIRVAAFSQDLDFLLEDPAGTIALAAVGAVIGVTVFLPLFYLGMELLGVLAGTLLVAQLLGSGTSDLGPAVAIGGIAGFILMGWAIGRGSLLIPIFIGGALIAFALGLGPVWILIFALIGGLMAGARSGRGKQMMKREKVPTLTLKEGRVKLEPPLRVNAEGHTHAILPEMADNRSDSPIKR